MGNRRSAVSRRAFLKRVITAGAEVVALLIAADVTGISKRLAARKDVVR
jgi:hypothetical protein